MTRRKQRSVRRIKAIAGRFVEARQVELEAVIHLRQLKGMVEQAGRVYDRVNESMGDREAELAAIMSPGQRFEINGLVLICERSRGIRTIRVENGGVI